MFKLGVQYILALLFFGLGAGLVDAQIHIAPTVESNFSYEDGFYLGVGLGIRQDQVELIPSFLYGEGIGGKLEFRWYKRFSDQHRFRPYFTVQQVVFRRINACIANSCPFVFYQFLPGAGTTVRVWNRFQMFGSVTCGIKKQQENRLQTDFLVAIGGRYEF